MKVLISGPSGISCGLGNRLEIISNISSIKNAHEEMGDIVEQRPIVPGESLSEFGRVYLIQQTIASWSAPYALGFLYAVGHRDDAIICFDDWQAPEAFKVDKYGSFEGLINCAWNPKLTRSYRDEAEKVRDTINEGIKLLCSANDRHYLLPVFIGGKYSAIRCHGEALPYSPYPFMRKYSYTTTDGLNYMKRARWVMASLQDNSRWVEKQGFIWPVLSYGVRKLGQQRITEAQLAKVYASSWGVLSPPHPKLEGTGWFRVRVPMAIDAGSIIFAPPADAQILFGGYYRNINHLENLSTGELIDQAKHQEEQFKNCIWNKEQFKDFISSL